MTVLKLVSLTDPILRRRTRGVPHLLPGHRRLISDMNETLLATEGLGLSANQVGSRHRIALVKLPTWPEPLVFVNPRILTRSGKYQVKEGCLSIPGYFGIVERHEKVTVKLLDLTGHPITMDATGLLAHVLQHEVDHLDGKLYIERLAE